MEKIVKYLVPICIIVISFLAYSCYQVNKVNEVREYEIVNVKIYKDTPAWELALAVKKQKTSKIEELVKEELQLLNYQDPKYGATLLMWAVGMEKYESAETLLKCGANPNISTKKYGETPLFKATGFSWIDNDAKKDPKYVKLLLSYGADQNKTYIGIDDSGQESVIEPGTSPLMNTINGGIEKTKALVEAGANINYKTKSRNTAAIEALSSWRNPEYAYYLIVEKRANVKESFFGIEWYSNEEPNEEFYPVGILRYWVFDLDSQEYKMKMEIVDEFARQGVDYWETPILESILEQIKKLYPKTWEEYIKKY